MAVLALISAERVFAVPASIPLNRMPNNEGNIVTFKLLKTFSFCCIND